MKPRTGPCAVCRLDGRQPPSPHTTHRYRILCIGKRPLSAALSAHHGVLRGTRTKGGAAQKHPLPAMQESLDLQRRHCNGFSKGRHAPSAAPGYHATNMQQVTASQTPQTSNPTAPHPHSTLKRGAPTSEHGTTFLNQRRRRFFSTPAEQESRPQLAIDELLE